jgi:hypothetical protein
VQGVDDAGETESVGNPFRTIPAVLVLDVEGNELRSKQPNPIILLLFGLFIEL